LLRGSNYYERVLKHSCERTTDFLIRGLFGSGCPNNRANYGSSTSTIGGDRAIMTGLNLVSWRSLVLPIRGAEEADCSLQTGERNGPVFPGIVDLGAGTQ
jgi:hypothetical protein